MTLDPNNATMITTTIVIVLFSTVVSIMSLISNIFLSFSRVKKKTIEAFRVLLNISNFWAFFQVFGFLTKPLVDYLLPASTSNTNRRNPRDPGSPKEDMTLPLLSLDESASENLSRAKENVSMLMDRPVYTIHSYWRRFDHTYMRPIFGGPSDNESSC